MSALSQLRRNPRVAEASLEEGGDLVMVTLKKPWCRYGTGCRDGNVKGFQIDELDPDENEDNEFHLREALRWVREDVYRCTCDKCKPARTRK